MLDRLFTLYHPEVFQGDLSKTPYFEGWYYKLVDREERHRLALIPGVSLADGDGSSHAFLQVIDGTTAETQYLEHSLDEFKASHRELDVRVGRSRFTLGSIDLDISAGDFGASGEVRLTRPVRWPSTLTRPGVMGPFAFMPMMECYHGVVSLDHRLIGAFDINGERIDFSGGRGYIEKDWGRSFPSAYVWIQSNHFERPGTSIMASIARIPWIGRDFNGFIVALWLDGRRRLFSTYSGAELESFETDDDRVGFSVADRHFRLEVEASRPARPEEEDPAGGGYVLLRSPEQGEMKGRIAETLTAEVELQLTRRRRWPFGEQLLYEGRGRNGGLEIEAETDDLAPGRR